MKIVKEFMIRNIAGEYILVPTGDTAREFNGLITMSETGKFIWDNLERADSLEDLARMITEEYEIDRETAQKDAVAFIGQLLSAGFVVCTKEDKTW